VILQDEQSEGGCPFRASLSFQRKIVNPESGLLAEMVSLIVLTVKSRQIEFVNEEMLKLWVEQMRETLKTAIRGLARRAIQHFLAKVIIRVGTGTSYYVFPLKGEL
jgi:hypothetical protein